MTNVLTNEHTINENSSLSRRTLNSLKTNRNVLVILIVVIFSFAVGIYSLSLINAGPSTDFGESLENVLPAFYWASIAVMIVANVYMLQSSDLKRLRIPFLFSCALLIFSMRSVLAILSPYPPVPDTWGGIYITETWRKYGFFSSESFGFFSGGYVRGWPTSFILAYLITYEGVPVYTFYQWTPTILLVLDLVAVYFLFKELVNEKVGMVSAFLFSLLNTNSFFPLHYCAQGLAALFYLVTMYTIVKAYKTKKLKNLAFVFLGIFAIVLTHHMTTFYLGISLFGAFVIRYFPGLRQKLGEKSDQLSLNVKLDTLIKVSLPLSVFTFALWYFYGFIVYRIDASWMLTEIMRLLITHQPRYGAGYYYNYLMLSPLGKISVLIFPAFILGTAAITLFGKMLKKESLEGYLWFTIGWGGMLILAFIFGNTIYGNYVDPSRSREIIAVALFPASALFLLKTLESSSLAKKTMITAVFIVVAFFSVFSIYRGAQGLIYFEPPWWMIIFGSP